jgi:hypothetical protein
VQVPLTTIDKIVAELGLPRVDFIKMDVEGSEVNALQGAAETIRKWKPRMAISTEHDWDDQFEIPKTVRNLRPEYQMQCVECLELNRRIQPDVITFW